MMQIVPALIGKRVIVKAFTGMESSPLIFYYLSAACITSSYYLLPTLDTYSTSCRWAVVPAKREDSLVCGT